MSWLLGGNVSAGRHNGDWNLLEQLGLRRAGFRREWTDLGTVRSEDWRIKVEVSAIPAQFWRFSINRRDGKEKFVVRTGSGSFSGYWPVAKRVAEFPPDLRCLKGDARDGMVVLEAEGIEYEWATIAAANAALKEATA